MKPLLPVLFSLSLLLTLRAGELPAESPTTVVRIGAAVAEGLKAEVVDSSDALDGAYATHTGEYRFFATAPLPPEGDPLAIWVRSRGASLQMKTRLGDSWDSATFPWFWTKYPQFTWRKVGEFSRSELGDRIFFITPPSSPPDSGVDAIVITADLAWTPE